MSFGGFSYSIDSSAGPSYTQSLPFASPPQNVEKRVMKKVEKRVMMMSKAF
jgi:hypothetical protein